jgi:hypothetical protein
MLLPLQRYFRNLFRPWKVVTFALGTAFFVWGAGYFDAPTWDVGVSWLMSVLCYLLGPFAVDLGIQAARERGELWQWRLLLAAALVYFIASGSYEIYNTVRMGQHPITYWYNLAFSVPVTLIAGFVWRYDGSISDFIAELRRTHRRTL